MPTDDRWSPGPPRGEGRARPGTRGQAASGPPPARGQNRNNGYNHGQAPDGRGYAQPWAPRQAPPQEAPGYPPYDAPARPIRSHGQVKRVPLWAVIVLILGLAAVGVGLRFVPGSPLAPSATGAGSTEATPTPTPTPPPLPFRAAEVSLPDIGAKGFVSWALMDRRTGEIQGSTNMNQTTWTASMIKGWLASDYLRRASEAHKTPTNAQLHDLEIMIKDSDNGAATRAYNANGKTESIKRMISLCALTDAKSSTEGWGYTTVSAQDTVRMADCIANGTAAGTQWTSWVLDAMRGVRGVGDFGIRKALPADVAANVSIKNGWDFFAGDDNLYHVNCMAVSETWAMAVLLRYPGPNFPSRGNDNIDIPRGQTYCQTVATQLLNPEASTPTSPAP